jgi:tetratricopeptide (TPR) repeat protein
MSTRGQPAGALAALLLCLSVVAQTPGKPLDVDQMLRELPLPGLPNDGFKPTLRPVPVTYDKGASFEDKRLLAYDWMAKGRILDALPVFAELVALQPADKASRIGYGSALIQARRHPEAEKVLRELLDEFPAEYTVLNNLAWMHATSADPKIRNGKLAGELAQRALLIAPADYHIWSTMAEAYYIQGEYTRAERFAREALTLAMRMAAPESLCLEYRQQLDRCRRAAQALQIME